jgi:superfamily II DNA or RNA helicase
MSKINLRNVPVEILNNRNWNTKTDNVPLLFKNLFINSTSHDMGVGYFSSSWIEINARGIAEFLTNEGTGRWLMSPNFNNEKDYELIEDYENQTYEEKTNIMEKILAKNVEEVTELLKNKHNIISSIKDLINSKKLEIKVCVPIKKFKSQDALFHLKAHFFKDKDSNIISVYGTGNASWAGMFDNIDSYEPHANFKKNSDHDNHPEYEERNYIKPKMNEFEDLWNNNNPQVYEFKAENLSDVCLEKIKTILSTNKNKTRASSKIREDESLSDDNSEISNNFELKIPDKYFGNPSYDKIQDFAISEFEKKKFSLILAMATGTGKTITSLKCFVEFIKGIKSESEEKPIVLAIACPGELLINQWNKYLLEIGFKKEEIFLYTNSTKGMISEMSKQLIKSKKLLGVRAIVFKHDMFEDIKIRNKFLGIKDRTFFIIDEIHRVMFREALSNLKSFFSDFEYKIGLTATVKKRTSNLPPEDDLELYIQNYFGKNSISEIVNLFDAIHKYKVLCEYNYYPISYVITQEECDKAKELYEAIPKWQSKNKEKDKKTPSNGPIFALTNYMNSLQSKTEELLNHLNKEKLESLSKSLFFVNDQKEVDDIASHFSKYEFPFSYINAHTKTNDRESMLKSLESDSIKAILSHTILDEGIDVPSIHTAYITSAFREPRQGIQRRGRVLRKDDSKSIANIYDMVCDISSSNIVCSNKNFLKWLKDREQERVNEFYESASNNKKII